jgi:hypothetical protein
MLSKVKYFFRFLKLVGIYKLYIENTNNFKLTYDKNFSLIGFLERIGVEDYLVCVFPFRESNEGENFWWEVDRLWVSFRSSGHSVITPHTIEYIKKLSTNRHRS